MAVLSGVEEAADAAQRLPTLTDTAPLGVPDAAATDLALSQMQADIDVSAMRLRPQHRRTR